MPFDNLPLIQPSVLIVDDSLVERQLYVHLLKKWGYAVDVASDGVEALQRLQAGTYELILADWQMPGMNGSELCAQVRQMQFVHDVYIILMSAQREEAFLISALEAGADDVLNKPVDTNELEARLQSAERRLALQRKLNQQNARVSEAYETMAQDLRRVSEVQRSYLPESQNRYTDVFMDWTSVPSQYVSGDHLNVFPLTADVYGFYILDVSGHGIPAAVKSMQLVQMFGDLSNTSVVLNHRPQPNGAVVRTPHAPRDVVSRLNRLFQQTDTDLSYFTLIYGTLQPATGKLVYCQAGHPTPFVVRANGQVEINDHGCYPVGLFETDEFEDVELTLHPGDSLLLYSDGVTEVLSPEHEQFGQQGLQACVRGHLQQHQNLHGLFDKLLGKLKAWAGPEAAAQGFEDDISVLLLGVPTAHGQNNQPSVLQPLGQDNPPGMAPQTEFKVEGFQKPDTQPQPQTDHAAKASIVIVDDSRSFVRIFQAMLTTWGYQVYPAQSAHEAVQLIEAHHPNFVLTDWDMPGMSGIELCEYVRAQDFSSYIYIMMITGFASRDDLLHSLKVGADDFLTKPLNPSELKVRLQTAVRVSAIHRTLQQRHEELSRVYSALQRDMREVARIQRSLLPKEQESPWPVAVQTLYSPRQYVCGVQMGTLKTAQNELGFLMIAVPGQGTSAALRAMALSRWFSMSKATALLFPPDGASHRIRRFLTEPAQVQAQLGDISPDLADGPMDFALLYGLLNLDQGTLLVAGIGPWTLTVVQPDGEALVFNTQSDGSTLPGELAAGVLHHDYIAPGTQLFVAPQSTLQAMGLKAREDWAAQTAAAQHSPNSAPLRGVMQNLEQLGNAQLTTDVALLGLQWRLSYSIEQQEASPAVQQQAQALAAQLAGAQGDAFRPSNQTLDLGAYQGTLQLYGVADTATIGEMATHLHAFLAQTQHTEETAYAVDLVVSESLNNVMHHGFKQVQPLPITLRLAAFEHAVLVWLQDSGSPIPSAVLEHIPNNMDHLANANLGELPEGGMGLTFIRMTAERMRYDRLFDHNELSLLVMAQGPEA